MRCIGKIVLIICVWLWCLAGSWICIVRIDSASGLNRARICSGINLHLIVIVLVCFGHVRLYVTIFVRLKTHILWNQISVTQIK